jgi:hypothetical protein
LDGKGDTCNKRKRKHSNWIDEIRKQEGEIYTGAGSFSTGAETLPTVNTDFENRGKLYAGALLPPMGRILSQAHFSGGESMLQHHEHRKAKISQLALVCPNLSILRLC